MVIQPSNRPSGSGSGSKKPPTKPTDLANTTGKPDTEGQRNGGQFGFGPSSMFGFENPFHFFYLQQPSSVLSTTGLGISSVAATLPCSIRKPRYRSSSYSPRQPQSIRLIYGRWKAWAAPLSPSGPTILLIIISYRRDHPTFIECSIGRKSVGVTIVPHPA